MAILRKGVLGGFSGKVGPATGSSWRHLDILKGPSSKKIKKENLLPQNFMLDVLSRFLKPFRSFIRIGFYHKKNKDSPFNRAMHYNWDRAVIGVAPNYQIDYKKIILSRGPREPAWAARAILENETQMKITWEIPETTKIKLIGNDRAVVLIYNERTEKVLSSTTAIRSDLSVSIYIPMKDQNSNLYLWMFFVSADGKSVSNSDYIGSLSTEL